MVFNMKNTSCQEDSNDDHFLSQEEIQDIAYNCIISYQTSDSTGKHFARKKIKQNDIVLFKTNKSLHSTFDYYKIGLVKDTYEDYDYISRKIDIQYFLSVEGNVREMQGRIFYIICGYSSGKSFRFLLSLLNKLGRVTLFWSFLSRKSLQFSGKYSPLMLC